MQGAGSPQGVILRRVPPDEEPALSEALGRVERDLGGGHRRSVPQSHPPRFFVGLEVLLRLTNGPTAVAVPVPFPVGRVGGIFEIRNPKFEIESGGRQFRIPNSELLLTPSPPRPLTPSPPPHASDMMRSEGGAGGEIRTQGAHGHQRGGPVCQDWRARRHGGGARERTRSSASRRAGGAPALLLGRNRPAAANRWAAQRPARYRGGVVRGVSEPSARIRCAGLLPRSRGALW